MTLLEIFDKQEEKENIKVDIGRMKHKIRSTITSKWGGLGKFCKENGFNRPNLQNWFTDKKDINFSTFIKLLLAVRLELTVGQSDIIWNDAKIFKGYYSNESQIPKGKRAFKL